MKGTSTAERVTLKDVEPGDGTAELPRAYSSEAEQLTADQQVDGSFPSAPFIKYFFGFGSLHRCADIALKYLGYSGSPQLCRDSSSTIDWIYNLWSTKIWRLATLPS